jgi:hypothetical protein
MLPSDTLKRGKVREALVFKLLSECVQKLSKNTFISPHLKFKDAGTRVPTPVLSIVHVFLYYS